MQYIYTECNLPSNGLIYPITTVHIRPKTIFDIKKLLNDPVYMLKSEIDALQHCIDPNDKVNIYELINQDVVYLLYKLRSLSDDILKIRYKSKVYDFCISDLEVKYLDEWNTNVVLPESNVTVVLKYQPIKNIFNIERQKMEFQSKYPDYNGDITNTINILNSIESFNNITNVDIIRTSLEELSWKDSIYLLNAIDNLNSKNFGVEEFVKIDYEGTTLSIPIQINEDFFRPSV